MIEAIVRASLQQRLVLLVIFVVLGVFGARSVQKLSLDAFPDVTTIQVQVATEARGRSPEEVERFVTVPIEIALTGLPGLREMRSLNRAGLSLVTLVFSDATDVYFARQLVLERLIEVQARLPDNTVPVLGPVSTGLGQVYQYTLERADDGRRALTREELTERRIVQDWVVRPMLRGISGVAEVNSHGGYVRQYQVLADPQRVCLERFVGNHVEHLEADRARDRVAAERAGVCSRRPIHDVPSCDQCSQGHARCQTLCQTQNVRLDAPMFDGEHLARASHSGLHLVRDVQDAMLLR